MSNVKLVSITQPLIEECKTAEELIAYCARVSNPSNQGDHQSASKLLKYLLKHKHWSPLEMVDITMEINVQRDIGRQILRHRSFSFQEFSQRYANVNELGFELREARLQDLKNRQNSLDNIDDVISKEWKTAQLDLLEMVEDIYNLAIESGIAKEVARVILPEGLVMSRMYMKGSLRSWIHYCQLRMGPETQKEHREVAAQCWKLLCEQIPSVTEILNETPTN